MSHILNDFFFIGPRDALECRNELTYFLLQKDLGSNKNVKNSISLFKNYYIRDRDRFSNNVSKVTY